MIVPVQSPTRLIPPLIGAARRWLQRAPHVPTEPEPPFSNVPVEGEPQSPPEGYELSPTKPTERSGVYHAGQNAANKLKEALDNDWNDFAAHVARAVDGVNWISGHIPNIVASVDSYLEGPKDMEELNEAAQSESEPGYQDHHIVEQGPQNDDLSLDEKKRINDPANIVRIPYYTHQRITNYYRNTDDDPPLNGLAPREYLRGKSFDERYQFGLNVLRAHGVLK